ncbi:unnamed protein product [Soboliphyme baturini]|uniref:RING-type domain-containing protein n=1 Tax=Soboliphyme baturini TaxID=241478 RepID=A0A183J2N1_9BILA|nr:unnamed protein product [Soboliphyme baturini]
MDISSMISDTRCFCGDNFSRRNAVMTGQPPPSYSCNRCGLTGHWIKSCPTLNMKRTTGIPKDELIETTPDDPQAMLTSSGTFAVPIMHKQAYLIGKKEKPPFKREIPPELLCTLCSDLLKDAVLIPCCGYSFCDECIRNQLLESDNHECPNCHEKGISPVSLIPNGKLRQAVDSYQNESSYSHARSNLPLSDESNSHVANPTISGIR